MKTKLLRFPEVQEMVGLSRTTIWRLEKQGKFPARRAIGENSVGWLKEDIEKWIKSKKSIRKGK